LNPLQRSVDSHPRSIRCQAALFREEEYYLVTPILTCSRRCEETRERRSEGASKDGRHSSLTLNSECRGLRRQRLKPCPERSRGNGFSSPKTVAVAVKS
jgi:hypothetical protein